MDIRKRILFQAFSTYPLLRPDPRPRTLHQFGFIVQLEHCGPANRRSIEGDESRWRGREGTHRRSDARDRSLRKRWGDALQDGKRRENRRINSHLASPSDLVPRGKRLRSRCNATTAGRSANNLQLHRECSRRRMLWRRGLSSLEDERRSARTSKTDGVGAERVLRNSLRVRKVAPRNIC